MNHSSQMASMPRGTVSRLMATKIAHFLDRYRRNQELSASILKLHCRQDPGLLVLFFLKVCEQLLDYILFKSSTLLYLVVETSLLNELPSCIL